MANAIESFAVGLVNERNKCLASDAHNFFNQYRVTVPLCSCGNPFGSLVFQRFHRTNIAWNYSRKEEDWCRIVLSMSDGSSRAGNLLRIYKSLMAQCLTDILLTSESRHFYHITIEWGGLYYIDTSLSFYLINDIKHRLINM